MHLLASNCIGDVGQPCLGSALLDDALRRPHDHGAKAQGWGNQIELLVKVKVLALYVSVRDTTGRKPSFRLFLCLSPTHSERLAIAAKGAR